ncbi:MAG: C39 family peptidase [Candidatus Improbicoccus devescovinae]|nr:MAG: C39 family peptidase [Candidatus Improbicoccus devescovinae]
MNNKFVATNFPSISYVCKVSNLSDKEYATSENANIEEPNISESTEIQKPTKLINVPYINQDDIVFGCEAVSATMLLQYYGYTISEKDFTDSYLIQKDWNTNEDGRAYGPDPNAAFPGNPYIDTGENCGYGCFAPALKKSIKKILNPELHEAKVTTGLSMNDLIMNYIDKDKPVLLWATMGMAKSSPGDSWIINFTDENSPYKIGDEFTWPRNEHCLVLVGYDTKHYIFNDPYKNKGVIPYEKSLVNERFLELGKQSVVILNKEKREETLL